MQKPGVTKFGKMGIQSMLGWWITKCGNSGLQNVLGVGLQSIAKWITKCVKDYKVSPGGLQSASRITKCGGIARSCLQKCLLLISLQNTLNSM